MAKNAKMVQIRSLNPVAVSRCALQPYVDVTMRIPAGRRGREGWLTLHFTVYSQAYLEYDLMIQGEVCCELNSFYEEDDDYTNQILENMDIMRRLQSGAEYVQTDFPPYQQLYVRQKGYETMMNRSTVEAALRCYLRTHGHIRSAPSFHWLRPKGCIGSL